MFVTFGDAVDKPEVKPLIPGWAIQDKDVPSVPKTLVELPYVVGKAIDQDPLEAADNVATPEVVWSN